MHFHRRSLKFAVSLLLALSIFAPAVAQEEPWTIPYQGQLTDHEGRPVDRAVGVALVFRIYSGPVGGTAQWSETHENVSVAGGRFSVLLGSRTPFSDLSMLKRTVYLGVTVDDGDLATAAVEMRPRQAIVPVIAAVYATQADHAKEALRAHNANTEIPIGGITMYYGKEEDLQENWRICDGNEVRDPASPFVGQKLPDLRGLFIRGATNQQEVNERKIVGRDRDTHYHKFEHETSTSGKADQSTYATIVTRVDYFGIGDLDIYGYHKEDELRALLVNKKSDISHAHSLSILKYTKWDENENTQLDNRPRHAALHYIIRIK